MRNILIIILALLYFPLSAQKPKVYINLVSHNEDNYGYLNNPAAYYNVRENMISFAKMCQEKNAKWHLGSDYILPLAVLKNDTGSVLNTTAGKNILKYLNENLNVSIDAHSHESAYNYTDVWHLLDSLNVNVSEIMSGFLVNQDQHGHYWTDYQNPVPGDSFPHVNWQPKYLWGAGTPNHSNDPLYTGVWQPKDTTVNTGFITHDTTKYLIYYGSGCRMEFDIDTDIHAMLAPFRKLITNIQEGILPENGTYCTSIFFRESALNDIPFILKTRDLIDSINYYVKQDYAEWMKIDTVIYNWKTLNKQASIHHCNEYITGIKELANQNRFELFPNPATDILQINNTKNELYDLEIFNSCGQLIFSARNISGKFNLNIRKWKPELYIIKIKADNSLLTKKFIKL